MNPPTIQAIAAKTLVGIQVRTTLATDNPVSYWKPFKMGLSKIENALTDRFYSIQTYDALDFDTFSPQTEFTKWAAVEVSGLDNIPEGMAAFELPAGNYSVFKHKGTPTSFHLTTQYIFDSWLPNSEYELDNRPRFELMDKDYVPTDANAKELVYIPIKKRQL